MDNPTPDAEALEGLSDAGKERRRRARITLALLLLLLLLLCLFAVLYETIPQRIPGGEEFVEVNKECLECHTDLIAELELKDVHNPFLKKNCKVCHTDHGDISEVRKFFETRRFKRRCGLLFSFGPFKRLVGDLVDLGTKEFREKEMDEEGNLLDPDRYRGFKRSKLVTSKQELCFTCHGDMGPLLTKDYLHNPFGRRDCLACHKPHASDYRPLLTRRPKDLCVQCHRIVEDLQKADVHPPFEARSCTSCHNPHASDYKGVLVDSQNVVCVSCHQTIARFQDLPVQHPPFHNGRCTECHEPHSSDPRPLLQVEQPTLCYNCHPQIQYDFLQPSHHPVGTPLLNCSDCHQPHAAFYDFLLIAKDNNLCYTCHGSKQFFYVRTPHNQASIIAAPGLCINCHTPHGSVHEPLLHKPKIPTCTQCHPTKISTDDFDHNDHPVGGSNPDRASGGVLTCSSTCHDPHGTGRHAMLQQLPDGLCLLCHEVKEMD